MRFVNPNNHAPVPIALPNREAFSVFKTSANVSSFGKVPELE